ncbi:GTP-binding protein Rit1 isoform X1 [Lingula anatina]|uniref:small monomeric GTPase n=1 Tax=Lingula anatina TaxID=7574 RepID=A0A1S3JM85_LINAN|nr:GTP-binding protein Rit1 isoform X1 [Lingula anatina]|eukprot:XP_013411498.1 GTP-binding protein Rit1 isoform X1 [Lingula anatina]
MSAPQATNSQQKPGVRVYKVVILGDGGVGKSALTMQFVCHRFLDYHDPTIEDAYQHQAVIDGEAAQLDILDTAGQPEFTAMRDQYMREGEGFIICYSMIERRSFEEAIAYKQLIDRVRNRDDIPCVLAANKCDLEELRKVSTEEGRQLAQQFDCPFYETSAALRTNVDDTFSSLIREIRRKEKEAMIALEKRNRKRNRARRIQNFFQRINVFKRTESS